MRADLDTLLTAIYVLLDDFLPDRERPGRRPKITDAELITLAVAQVFLGISNDRQFFGFATWRLAGDGQALRSSPASPPTATAPPTAAGSGASASISSSPPTAARSPSNCFRPTPLSGRSPPRCSNASPRQAIPWSPTRASPAGSSKASWPTGAHFLRPDRKDERPRFGSPGSVRQRIESVFWTCKGQLGLERHGARTMPGLFARIGIRLLALSAGLWHNWQIGGPGKKDLQAISFCSHAILDPETTVIPDAREDEGFDDKPLVTGDPNIRFCPGQAVSGTGERCSAPSA